MSSLNELNELINIEDITVITTKTAILSIPETLELMRDVNVESLNPDLTFWTKEQKVVVYLYEDEHDEWESEVQLMRVDLAPSSDLIECIPESVTTVWKDPKSGKSFPFKTKAYNDEQIRLKEIQSQRKKEAEEKAFKELNEKIKRDEEYFSNLPTVKDEPFTIIKGGIDNNCRYITMPKDYPYSKTTYGLVNSFYDKVKEKSLLVIDFSGIAANNMGKLEVAARFSPLTTEKHYTKERIEAMNKYNKLYEDLEEKGKLVKIVGFSIESINYYNEELMLDEVAEQIKNELEALNKSN